MWYFCHKSVKTEILYPDLIHSILHIDCFITDLTSFMLICHPSLNNPDSSTSSNENDKCFWYFKLNIKT